MYYYEDGLTTTITLTHTLPQLPITLSHQVYYYEDGKKRPVPNAAMFFAKGWSFEDVKVGRGMYAVDHHTLTKLPSTNFV